MKGYIMTITESMVVALVGQLVIVKKRFNCDAISYAEFGDIGTYSLSKMLGLSRYKMMFILHECIERDFVSVKEKKHREYFDEYNIHHTVWKDVFFVTKQGEKKVQSWVELGKYSECVELVANWHNATRRSKIAKQIKRHKEIYGQASMFRDVTIIEGEQ